MDQWCYYPSPEDVRIGTATDEKNNRLDTNFSILVPLLVRSPVSERLGLLKKIFHIFIRDRVSIERMKNVIEVIVHHVDSRADTTDFLTPFLEHLMLECMKNQQCEIKEFPFALFANTFEEFMKINESVLAPLLLWYFDCRPNTITMLCKSINKNEKQLFRDNFVALASIYLPSSTCHKAKTLQSKTEEILGEEKHDRLLR